MAIANKEEFLEYVSNLSVIDLVDHIEAMEEKFGVTAAAAAMLLPCLAQAAVMHRLLLSRLSSTLL